MLLQQQKIQLSAYSDLYDLVVPQDNSKFAQRSKVNI
ncbi:hypothetical protein NBC122_00619 [Chryseobacterium salivictor]|uniref:Uncharacterized protein n=1 Tax=Chryseobacterium salivictor TaxID=2547600 RepID=A0A4P6ZDE3_9FLAO|nr:hypothetical protein NBC122_00619 [Chryseobacterium salivictor]